jgi:hypothetical protein
MQICNQKMLELRNLNDLEEAFSMFNLLIIYKYSGKYLFV